MLRTLCLLLVTGLALSACTAGPERRLLQEADSVVELESVPFFAQDDYQCGPAALATVLVDAGIEVGPEQLVSRVYIPDRRGSLQLELLAATRSYGLVPYRLPAKLEPLLSELESGQPVLLLQNLGLERWPVWHYAVLIGFDSRAETFLLRSGTTRRKQTSARAFLGSWERGGRWAIVAVSPAAPPASADVLGWLAAVAPFESTGKLTLAAQGYRAAVERWPEEGVAWTALGNVHYLQQNLSAAVQAYTRALELDAALWTARNNLVQALLARNCVVEARQWTAVAGEPPVELQDVWQATLAELALAGSGSCRDNPQPSGN